MLSALLIFSSRGDKILEEKYRNDIPEEQIKSSVSAVLSNNQGLNPPCFKSDGVHVYSFRRDKIIYIAVSKRDIPNIVVIQFLDSFYSLVKNFCGGANEDYIKKNLMLVHELMTECVDNGFIKTTNIEQLRPYIYSDPVISKQIMKTETKPGPFGLEKVVIPNAAAERPLVKSRSQQSLEERPEVFLDVIEKITAHFSKEGLIQRFCLDGVVQLKSFITLHHRINVILGDNKSSDGLQKCFLLDQCRFDKCVDKKDFEKHQAFVITPPQGEIKAMMYTLETPVSLPFRLSSSFQKSEASKDCDLTLRLFCNLPSNTEALNLSLHIPISSSTRNIMQQFSMFENSAEFLSKDRKILWKLKKLPGQEEVIAKFKLIDALQVPGNLLEMGPVSLEFEASNATCSGIAIKNIKAVDPSGKSIPIQKWVRYVTLAKSYVFLI